MVKLYSSGAQRRCIIHKFIYCCMFGYHVDNVKKIMISCYRNSRLALTSKVCHVRSRYVAHHSSSNILKGSRSVGPVSSRLADVGVAGPGEWRVSWRDISFDGYKDGINISPWTSVGS